MVSGEDLLAYPLLRQQDGCLITPALSVWKERHLASLLPLPNPDQQGVVQEDPWLLALLYYYAWSELNDEDEFPGYEAEFTPEEVDLEWSAELALLLRTRHQVNIQYVWALAAYNGFNDMDDLLPYLEHVIQHPRFSADAKAKVSSLLDRDISQISEQEVPALLLSVARS